MLHDAVLSVIHTARRSAWLTACAVIICALYMAVKASADLTPPQQPLESAAVHIDGRESKPVDEEMSPYKTSDGWRMASVAASFDQTFILYHRYQTEAERSAQVDAVLSYYSWKFALIVMAVFCAVLVTGLIRYLVSVAKMPDEEAPNAANLGAV